MHNPKTPIQAPAQAQQEGASHDSPMFDAPVQGKMVAPPPFLGSSAPLNTAQLQIAANNTPGALQRKALVESGLNRPAQLMAGPGFEADEAVQMVPLAVDGEEAPAQMMEMDEEEESIQMMEMDEEDESLQMMEMDEEDESIQMMEMDEEDESMQMKSDSAPVQRAEAPAPQPNNTGLPDNLKNGIEQLGGYSMDDVKVHYNSDKPAQLHAHAYAQGTDIHVGPGQEKHLPHEAWHVVQQKQGRVRPTMQMKGGVAVNDDAGLENEADVMGVKALQMKGGDGALVNSRVFRSSSAPVQLAEDPIESVIMQGDLETVKRDVNNAMERIIVKLQTLAKVDNNIHAALQGQGRDAWVYAGFFNRNKSLLSHLDQWSENWGLKKTCGLLLDLGLAVRRSFSDISGMTPEMRGSRGGDHKVNKNGVWAQGLPKGTQVQAGVSATTHNLLRTLIGLKVVEWGEIEAIMIGVIKYWKSGSKIKRLRGEFHTAAEVWAAYQSQLTSWYNERNAPNAQAIIGPKAKIEHDKVPR